MDRSLSENAPFRRNGGSRWTRSYEHLLRIPSFSSLFTWRHVRTKRSSSEKTFQPMQSALLASSSTNNVNTENSNSVSPLSGRKRRSKTSWSFRLKTFLRVPDFRFSSMDPLPIGSFKRRNQSSVQLASTPRENVINRSPSLYDRPGTLNLRSTNKQQFSKRLRDCSGSQPLLGQEKTSSSPWLTIPSTDFTSSLQSPSTRTSSPFTVSAENAQTPISPTPPAGVKVHLKRLLGSGANGFCHEVELIPLDCSDDHWQIAQMKDSGYENLPRQAALKVLPFDVYQSKSMTIHREITTQRHLTHSNVLRLFWAYNEQRLQAVCLLLEYCSMGSLMDLFDSFRTSVATPESTENDDSDKKETQSNSLTHDPTTGDFPYSLSRTIFRGMMLGLSYLHDEHGIVHRDIKPSNVLLADGFVAKLSDFGLACSEQQCLTEKSQICGTPNYLAPEVFLKEGHSKASDCWAAGATLYFMLCGRPPFQSLLEQTDHFLTEKLEQRRLSGATVRHPSNRSAAVQVRSICRNLLWGRYTFRSSLNQAARQTIRALLRRAPTARPTATKVLSMDFCTKSANSRSVRIAEQAGVEHGTWSGHTEASMHGLLDMRKQSKTTDGQVSIQDSRERKHIPIDRVFDENRASSVENVTIDANEENISMHRTIRNVGDTVYTGNRAVYDVFKLLFVRVNDHLEREPQRELVLHWVSRWALTNHPLLYYTLDEVLLRQTVGDINNPEVHTELCLPSQEESWGVTNQTGQGLMQFKGQRVIQFEHNATSNNSVTSQLPSMVDVRTHCEFLIRQLKHFSPISLQFSSISQDPTEHAISTDHSTSTVDPATDSINPVFVQRWRDHGNNVIFSFSTGGWQVNFHDHSKLIIHYPYLLVYADPGVSTVNGHTYHVLTSYDQLESEFKTWILLHSHLKSILQILLFTLL